MELELRGEEVSSGDPTRGSFLSVVTLGSGHVPAGTQEAVDMHLYRAMLAAPAGA